MDIKLENIVLSESCYPVLIDLEFVKKLSFSIGGTTGYASPEIEILRTIKFSNAKSDVYSLGVLLFILLHGKYPMPKK